jgi:general secretion pathway protein D
MITFIAVAFIQPMKRITYLLALLLVVLPGKLLAQAATAGDQAAPPSPSNQPPGQLTPPPDNAPATITTTSSAPSSTKLTSSEIARIRQQEIIRRQELVFQANESLKAGRKAELATNYPEARKDYLFSAEALSSISRSTPSYTAAADGLTRVDFQLYDDSLKIGDTARAKMLIDEVVKYNPDNKLAQEKLAATNEALANPNDTRLLGNPAITPGFVNQVNEVQQLFAEAEQFRRTGQWVEATARLKRILGIDPYNIAASRQLERIDAEKNQYDESARLEMRDERLRQVEEKWYEPINNKDATAIAQESQPSILRNTSFALDEKLKNIYLSLDFNNATIEEATNFLSIESKRLDPDHKGVNFVIQPEASTSATPVSITLNNVPLGEALRYVCQLGNVKFKVQDYAISIVPFTQNTDDLISRTFVVQPNFVAPPTAAGVIESATSALGGGTARPIAPPAGAEAAPTGEDAGGDTVRQALIAKGVKFPPGASAVYTPTTGQLTVVDTADQMELLEELVNAGQAPTLMVRIATKFVEINQQDLNDFTVNSSFNFFSHATGGLNSGGVTSHLLDGSSFSTALPGALAIAPDGVDQLISPQSNNTNAIYFRGPISPRK